MAGGWRGIRRALLHPARLSRSQERPRSRHALPTTRKIQVEETMIPMRLGHLSRAARAVVAPLRAVPGPDARKDHHRDLQRAVARRLHAAGDQGAEARPGERARHHLPGAHARRLHGAVQFRRVQGRRQRLAAHRRARRHPRRQGEVSVQPVRLLGRGGHLAAGDQDAQGSRGQAARRRPLHHQLRDVRVLRQEARRRRRRRSRW